MRTHEPRRGRRGKRQPHDPNVPVTADLDPREHGGRVVVVETDRNRHLVEVVISTLGGRRRSLEVIQRREIEAALELDRGFGRDRIGQRITALLAPELEGLVRWTRTRSDDKRRRRASIWWALAGAFICLARRHPREAAALCYAPVPESLVSLIRGSELRIHPCAPRL